MTSGHVAEVFHRNIARAENINESPAIAHPILQADAVIPLIGNHRAALPSHPDVLSAGGVECDDCRTDEPSPRRGLHAAGVEKREPIAAKPVDAAPRS